MDEKLKHDTAKKLNSYLKGTYMGIDAFEIFAQKAVTPELKKLIEKVSITYKKYAEKIQNKVKDLSEKPADEDSLDIKFGEFFSDIKYMMINDEEKLKEEIVKALDMADENSHKFLEKNDIHNDNSYKLIKDLVNENKQLLEHAKKIQVEDAK